MTGEALGSLDQRVEPFASGDHIGKVVLCGKALFTEGLPDVQLLLLNPLDAVQRDHHVRDVFPKIDGIARENVLAADKV